MTPSAGQIVVRTDACLGQMPFSGPTNIISSEMPEHDSWDEGRLPRSGTFVCLVISAQKQLNASVGWKQRNSLASARTETANPCCGASIEDRLANLPTCDYFSQTSIKGFITLTQHCYVTDKV